MSIENTTPIEPLVSESYLISPPPEHDQAILGNLINQSTTLKECTEPIFLKPNSLSNSPYQIRYSWKTAQGTPSIKFEFVKSDGSLINEETTQANLDFTPSDKAQKGFIEVAGGFGNNSNRGSHPLMDAPIRNISGVLAPYEDWICGFLSSKYETNVRRDGVTAQSKDSRFIKNYEARGYTIEKTENNRIKFQKDFPYRAPVTATRLEDFV